MDQILLYVPCRNTEKTIRGVLERISRLKFPHHILIVDNHSKDRTVKIARDYFNRNKMDKFTIVKNAKDMGYGGSNKIGWWFGINNNFDYMIVLHSDAQYPIEYSDRLIRKIKETGSDVVVGSRLTDKEVKKNMPGWKLVGNRLLSKFDKWAYNLDLSEFHSEFKIYDLKFMAKVDIDSVKSYQDHLFTTFIALLRKGVKMSEIPIPCVYHKDAQHPRMIDLAWLVVETFYRGLKYKLFKR